jgi:hypothetical protein
MSGNWSNSVSPEVAYKRAAGRRRINRQRQNEAARRRQLIAEYLFVQGRMFQVGIRSILATKLGVHRTTVGRDIKQLLRAGSYACSHCGAMVTLPADPLDPFYDRADPTRPAI